MSGLSRRSMLKGAALVSTATALPLGVQAMGTRRVVIYDSGLPASMAFARTTPGTHAIDIADAHAARFADLRRGLPEGVRVEALTRWSDHVALRRELYRQGFRLDNETRSGNLIRWTMSPR